MLIKVTQEHIDKGLRAVPNSCPIALAILDTCQCGFISVGVNNCVFDVDNHSKSVYLPLMAILFIRLFDSHQPVEPFEFELEEVWPS